MPIIQKPNNEPLNPQGVIGIPGWMVPSFRSVFAVENGVPKNALIKAHGGVGDVVCSEPSIRYALEHFKDAKISLLTPYPELFRHLEFWDVWVCSHDDVPAKRIGGKNPDPKEFLDLRDYMMYQTIDVTNELANEFICHAVMSGVDYASLFMWRLILPNEMKRVVLQPTKDEYDKARKVHEPEDVIIHPGKTWRTRTFPKGWWDKIITGLLKHGARPVLVGGVVDKGRASTVDVDVPPGVVDLRYSQTLTETLATLHQSKVLLTNDSSPLHMAATGNTWIGYLSTVKHRDHLTHWRRPKFDLPGILADSEMISADDLTYLTSAQVTAWPKVDIFGWRMKDFARGNVWEGLDIYPNNQKSVHVDGCDVRDLLSWLPDPEEVVDWAVSKL